MATFSYTCAKTHLPYLNSSKFKAHPFAKAVVVREDGSVSDAPADLKALRGDLEAGRAKLVLKEYFDPANDTFASLGFSKDDPGQGHFHKPAFLKKLVETGPFASYPGYVLAFQGLVQVPAAAKVSAELGETVLNAAQVMAAALTQARVRSLVPDVLPAVQVKPYYHIRAKLSGDKLQIVAHTPDGMLQLPIGKMVLAKDGTVSPGFDEMAERIVKENPLKQVLDVTLVRGGEDVARVTRHDTGAGERLFIVEDPKAASKLLFPDSMALMAHYKVDPNNYLVRSALDNFQPADVEPRLDLDKKPEAFSFFDAAEDEDPSSPKP